MSTLYLGVDVHCKRSSYVAQDDTGNVVGKGEVPTTREGMLEMKKRVAAPDGTEVGVETGTMTTYVSRVLQEVGLCPVVVDAREVRAKARRPTQKTDSRDAFEICDGVRRGIYVSLVHIPPPEVQRVRELLAQRRHCVRLMTREVNAAKHRLRAAGFGVTCRSLRTAVAWEKLLRQKEIPPDLRAGLGIHGEMWRCAQDQVSRLDAELRVATALFEEDQHLLETIPGVGPIVAWTVLAVFSDVSRFPSVKHAASYAGLVTSTFDTGGKERHGHLTKRGSSELRAMLVEAAHHAATPQHPLYPYFARFCVKRGYKMAVVAVAHRLLRIMVAMLKTRTPFEVKKLNVELRPERSRRLRYRVKVA